MVLFFKNKDRRLIRLVSKNEEKLLERLVQAMLGVIDNPEKTQRTTAIGTLF
jgi:molecular chaperone GrpE (heat shock protein)